MVTRREIPVTIPRIGAFDASLQWGNYARRSASVGRNTPTLAFGELVRGTCASDSLQTRLLCTKADRMAHSEDGAYPHPPHAPSPGVEPSPKTDGEKGRGG